MLSGREVRGLTCQNLKQIRSEPYGDKKRSFSLEFADLERLQHRQSLAARHPGQT